MRKILVAILFGCSFFSNAQIIGKDTLETKSADTTKTVDIEALKESIDEHSMKFSGLDEKLSVMESDLSKLTKIQISGYIQAQYDLYDTWTAAGVHGVGTPPITNSFYLRRARIKFAYKAAEGLKFVLQPEFAFDKVSLKDAYVVLNDRWTNTFSLYMGQFDRPNYEVEYSSGSLENLERTKMIGILYPGERDLGVKLEANFATKYKFPLKVQLAVVNGNGNLGATTNQVKDIDNNKDVIARAVYSAKFKNTGLGIDFGAHGYFGKTEILPGTTLTGFTNENNVAFTPKIGDKLDKKWFGGEMQVYYDFLGGMSLKGEYIAGTISGTTNPIQVNSGFNFNRVRDFSGFYTTLIKNVGKSHQFIARYDVWDPNSKLSGNKVDNAGDLKYSTWSFSWQYFFDSNIKINFGYAIPTNEKSSNAGINADYLNRDKKDNVFTIRLQAKF